MFIIGCTCGPIKDKRLHFINKSNKTIYVENSTDTGLPMYVFRKEAILNIQNGDTIWYSRDFFVKPHDTIMIPGLVKWDTYINNLSPEKKCYFFFIDFNLYRKKLNGADIPKDSLMIVKSYSLDDLKKMDWIIVYP
jgi:hypothetical protein